MTDDLINAIATATLEYVSKAKLCCEAREKFAISNEAQTAFHYGFKAGTNWQSSKEYPRDKVYIHGSDGCSNCETGRITLFAHSNQCIECNPEAYEREKP